MEIRASRLAHAHTAMDERDRHDFGRSAGRVRTHAFHQHGCLHYPERDWRDTSSGGGAVMKRLWIGCVFLALASPAATVRVTDSVTRAVTDANPGDTILIAGPAVFHE